MATQHEHDHTGGSDPVSWQHELACHDRWLRTSLLARLRDPEAVEEVMQEVALAAIRQASPLQDRSKVAPWLYRVAIHQALLYRRRRGRQRRLEDNAALGSPRDGAPGVDPLNWLLAQERRQLLRRALAELGSRDAEILLLKYTENWNYYDIAAHLGVSHSAVETRLHRARQRLRHRLAFYQLVDAGELA
jgi:RNA polymerase sigma-70 factor (ECF subfamily)